MTVVASLPQPDNRFLSLAAPQSTMCAHPCVYVCQHLKYYSFRNTRV